MLCTDQVGRAGERVGLPAAGLSVAEDSRRKPIHTHVYQPNKTQERKEIISLYLRKIPNSLKKFLLKTYNFYLETKI